MAFISNYQEHYLAKNRKSVNNSKNGVVSLTEKSYIINNIERLLSILNKILAKKDFRLLPSQILQFNEGYQLQMSKVKLIKLLRHKIRCPQQLPFSLN